MADERLFGPGAAAGQGKLEPLAPTQSKWEQGSKMILNEMVRSFGFHWDEKSGILPEWNIENVAKAAEEHPFWFALDWATVAYAPVKAGITATQVARGGGAVSKAYRAGKFAEVAAETRKGRAIEKVGRTFGAQEGLGAATEFAARAPAQSRVGRYFQSPASILDQEGDWDAFQAMVREHGHSKGDTIGIAKVIQRETERDVNRTRAWVQALQIQTGRAIGDDADLSEKFVRFLEHGVKPDDPRVVEALGLDGGAAYKNTWEFRNWVHDLSREFGLISDETWAAHKETYYPRVYREHLANRRRAEGVGGRREVMGTKKTPPGVDRYKRRTVSDYELPEVEEALGRILDPAVGAEELGRAMMALNSQLFARRLAGSAIAADAIDIAPRLMGAAQMGGREAAIAGVGGEIGREMLEELAGLGLTRLDEGASIAAQGERAGEASAAMERAIRKAGWERIDDYYERVGKAVPHYVKRLPRELRHKFIDPVVMKDVVGALETFSLFEAKGTFQKWYQGLLGYFRQSKTAYNPASWTRNWMGNVVNHHLALGGAPKWAPVRGWTAYKDGLNSPIYREFLEFGGIGGGQVDEARELLAKAFGELADQPGFRSGIDAPMQVVRAVGEKIFPETMAGGKVAKGVRYAEEQSRKAALLAEKYYQAIDEIWKLEAFANLKAKGLSGAEAFREVTRYFPQFSHYSQFAAAVRGHVPFGSWGIENVRVWKNALTYNPFRVFFWNHLFQGALSSAAMLSGADPKMILAANEGQPWYNQGKMMAAVPFFSNQGKPALLDLSYLIPGASLGQMERLEAGFFLDDGPVNPLANPFLSMLIALATGKDPYSDAPLRGDFVSSHLGINLSEKARPIVGYAEYLARTFLPPIVPPGYVGNNILEWATKLKHPYTGQDMEQTTQNVFMSNIFGLRMYEVDAGVLLQNEHHRQKILQGRLQQAWRDRQNGVANNRPDQIHEAEGRILAIRGEYGDDRIAAREYLEKGSVRREPGSFANVPLAHLQAMAARSRELGLSDPDDVALMGIAYSRLNQSNSRARRGRKSRSRKGRSKR